MWQKIRPNKYWLLSELKSIFIDYYGHLSNQLENPVGSTLKIHPEFLIVSAFIFGAALVSHLDF